MKVHLNQIPAEGLHIEGEEPRDILELNDAITKTVGPLHYSLDVGLSENGIFATGMVAQDFEMECTRCLQHFTYPLEIHDFAMQMELSGTETEDLTPQVREDIVLALPLHPKCDWNGETICPGLRQASFGVEAEPESDASQTWDALDQLNLKLKK